MVYITVYLHPCRGWRRERQWQRESGNKAQLRGLPLGVRGHLTVNGDGGGAGVENADARGNDNPH